MDDFRKTFWILPGAIIIWIYFALKGKIHSFNDIVNEGNWDYNVLFTFIFYALIFGLLIFIK